jgi:hypothetical protein
MVAQFAARVKLEDHVMVVVSPAQESLDILTSVRAPKGCTDERG